MHNIVLYVYMYINCIHFQILSHYGLLQDIELSSPWSLFIHFMYDSFHTTSPKLLIQPSPTNLFCESFLFCR